MHQAVHARRLARAFAMVSAASACSAPNFCAPDGYMMPTRFTTASESRHRARHVIRVAHIGAQQLDLPHMPHGLQIVGAVGASACRADAIAEAALRQRAHRVPAEKAGRAENRNPLVDHAVNTSNAARSYRCSAPMHNSLP